VSTSDLEEFEVPGKTIKQVLEKYHVNLAKAMLGKNGGYSLRALKRLYLMEKQD